MTVNTTIIQSGPYTGTGSTATYAYNFKIQESSEIVVVETANGVATTLVEGTDYSVTGVGDNGGGTVVRTTALPAGYTWLISRSTEMTQEADFPGQGAFTPVSHENAFDKLTQIVQELAANSIDIPSGERAGFVYSFDDAGLAEANIDADEVRALLAAGLSSGIAMTSDAFTGDGVTVAFTLSVTPVNEHGVLAAIDGVTQTPVTDYTVSGTTITFTTAPPDDADILVRNIGVAKNLGDADAVGLVLWPRSQAETDAGVTPVDYTYRWGDVRRLGAVDGADSTTALDNAALVGGDIYLQRGEDYWYNNTIGVSMTLAVAGTRVHGGGKITALDDAAHVISITAANCVVDGVCIQGDGTFTADKLVANDDRIALIKNTADNVTVKNCHLIDGPQNFIDFNGVEGGWISNNLIEGGITTYSVSTDTGYQGIRVVGSTDVEITDNRVIRNASNGYPAEGIYSGASATVTPANLTVTGNRVTDSWDHAIYMNNGVGHSVENNILRADGVPLVVAGGDISAGAVQGHTVTGNICKLSTKTPGAGTSGIYMRDANNCVVSDNVVHECPRGIYFSPVTYNSSGNTLSDNVISNNTIHGWTDQAIIFGKSGKTVGAVSRNVIQGNTLICDVANVEDDGAAISMVIGQEAAANIAFDNIISNNTINKSGNVGISLQYHTGAQIKGNTILDPVEAATPSLYDGIYTADSDGMTINDNLIRDTNGTPNMRGGIDGDNSTEGTSYFNNTVVNADPSYAPIRRTQHSGHTNSHRGNKTGTDSLTGLLTLANASTTTVTNDNWNYNLGHRSQVLLFPQDTAGAALSVWLDHSSGTDRASFVLDHDAAAGTEEFFYEIVQ